MEDEKQRLLSFTEEEEESESNNEGREEEEEDAADDGHNNSYDEDGEENGNGNMDTEMYVPARRKRPASSSRHKPYQSFSHRPSAEQGGHHDLIHRSHNKRNKGWCERLLGGGRRRRQQSKRGKEVQCRLIDRAKPYKYNVRRHGLKYGALIMGDLYHTLLDYTWWKLLLGYAFTFFCVHLCFATLYNFDKNGLGGIQPGEHRIEVTFWDCFFFSIQTMSTIGYGKLSPHSNYTNAIVCIQAFFGILFVAITTGFVFAKISRASRQKRYILFSDVAVVNCVEQYYEGSPDCLDEGGYTTGGCPCLVIRLANIRKSQLCETQLRLLLVRKERNSLYARRRATSSLLRHNPNMHSEELDIYEEEGDYMDIMEEQSDEMIFRIHELNFELNNQVGRVRSTDMSTPLLPLPWTIIHAMDKRSPLYGYTPELMRESNCEIIAVLDGIDEACSENLQARYLVTFHFLLSFLSSPSLFFSLCFVSSSLPMKMKGGATHGRK
ncbi:G protein-activated inward rectifier potassium channel 2, variant 2 [Balamuthia mandrillaris]